MSENKDSIIVDNVYKTFNVYLDKANTIKEKLLFLFSRNRKEKRQVLKGINLKIKQGEVVALIGTNRKWKINTSKIDDKNNIS
jgi:ABC-type polysaccharide/polyol phosphate transport system ATPase subunit